MNPSYRCRLTPRYAYHKPFKVKLLTSVNDRMGSTQVIKGEWSDLDGSKTSEDNGAGVYRWGSTRGTASALGSMPQYSRLKYTPSRQV
jgi:hypothetical protein